METLAPPSTERSESLSCWSCWGDKGTADVTVAVLSPRARDGATVSMPLTWAQVRGDLDPKRYTVRSVPALLAKSKAWDGYDDAASPIKAAMKKLVLEASS